MYEKNFVICDTQKKYADNLMKMFMLKKGGDYQYYLFHTTEELVRFSKERKIAVLLIDEQLCKEQNALPEAESIYVLATEKLDETGEYRQLLRYQSSEELWEHIHKKETVSNTVRKGKRVRKKKKRTVERTEPERGNGEMIAVYSPIHRIGKTRFAMELGKELAKKAPVLYLNLEAYSGVAYYFPEKEKEDLGDLIYYLRQKNEKTGLRISVMAGQDEGMDYIQPMKNLQDLMAVQCEEWIGLFDTILRECIYEKLIIDLGDEIDGLFQILQKCSCIYTPYIEGGIERAKLAQYTENLRRMGMEEILEKTVQKNMGRSVQAAVSAGV